MQSESGAWHLALASADDLSAERDARTPGVCPRAPAYRKMGNCPNELQRAVVGGWGGSGGGGWTESPNRDRKGKGSY